MLTGIRRHLNYTNIAVTLALVFAMSGGAYAAGKYLITSTKQISPKVLKTLKGAKGANGSNGANGTNGTNGTGAAGAVGPQGPAGPGGGPGSPGAPGESVINKKVEPGVTCKEGGAEFKVGAGTPTHACNGEKGVIHPGETLPKGSSETGVWAEPQGIEHNTGKAQAVYVPISFTIPLAAEIPQSNVHFIKPKEALPAGCKGTPEKPEAESGNLCVFAAVQEGLLGTPAIVDPETESTNNSTAGPRGTLLGFIIQENAEEALTVHGTWVVTG